MDDTPTSTFSDILERGSPDLISVRTVDGNVLFASDASTHILGLAAADYIGSNAFDYVHPEDLGRVRDEEANSDDDGVSVEHRVRRADGSWLWVESHTRLQRDQSSGVELIVGVTRDISARVAAEKQLNRQKVLNDAAAAVSPIAIVALDLEGQVLSCMGALFGIDGPGAFQRMLDERPDVDKACKLAISGTNSNLDLEWEGRVLESRFITLLGHSVGSIRAICLFLPRFERTPNDITRH